MLQAEQACKPHTARDSRSLPRWTPTFLFALAKPGQRSVLEISAQPTTLAPKANAKCMLMA